MKLDFFYFSSKMSREYSVTGGEANPNLPLVALHQKLETFLLPRLRGETLHFHFIRERFNYAGGGAGGGGREGGVIDVL